jgi:hypothetical protein
MKSRDLHNIVLQCVSMGWALVELQNSNRARKGDKTGPLTKTDLGYRLTIQ